MKDNLIPENYLCLITDKEHQTHKAKSLNNYGYTLEDTSEHPLSDISTIYFLSYPEVLSYPENCKSLPFNYTPQTPQKPISLIRRIFSKLKKFISWFSF
jgi:hypothetical protein